MEVGRSGRFETKFDPIFWFCITNLDLAVGTHFYLCHKKKFKACGHQMQQAQQHLVSAGAQCIGAARFTPVKQTSGHHPPISIISGVSDGATKLSEAWFTVLKLLMKQ